MKLIQITFAVTLLAAFCQCGSALNLLGGLTNALNGTLGSVTKVVNTVTAPVINTATDVLGTVAKTGEQVLGTATGALGGLGGVLDPLGSVVGGLVQSVGNVAEGILTTAGVLIDGVIGLTNELLQSIQIYTKKDIPIYVKPLLENNYACVTKLLLDFQTLHPEFSRTVCNIRQMMEFFYNFHDYCVTRPSSNEIEDCMEHLYISAPAELNRFSIDLALINADKALEWSIYLKEGICACYVMNG